MQRAQFAEAIYILEGVYEFSASRCARVLGNEEVGKRRTKMTLSVGKGPGRMGQGLGWLKRGCLRFGRQEAEEYARGWAARDAVGCYDCLKSKDMCVGKPQRTRLATIAWKLQHT